MREDLGVQDNMSEMTKWDKYFLDVAFLTADLSHCTRLKVGCIIVKNRRIISIGYNGMPSKWDNCCETIVDNRLSTKPEVLHAESNAIAKLAQSHESAEGATIYITHSPCMECAKLIYQSGIKYLFYDKEYRDSAGIDFLKNSGVLVTKSHG